MAEDNECSLKDQLICYTSKFRRVNQQELKSTLQKTNPEARYRLLKSGDGGMALHSSARNNDSKIMELLLDGLESHQVVEMLQLTDNTQRNAIHIATLHQSEDVIKYILFQKNLTDDQKYQILASTSKSGSENTALHYAAEKGYSDVARTLLSSVAIEQQAELLGIKNKKGRAPAETMPEILLQVTCQMLQGVFDVIFKIFKNCVAKPSLS